VIFDVDQGRIPIVAHILTRVFKNMTENEAKMKADEALEHGRSIVQTCIQVQAEEYCETLRTYDLKSIIEPY
jgi:ATP-dependent Clp protease adapter protein ClpS